MNRILIIFLSAVVFACSDKKIQSVNDHRDPVAADTVSDTLFVSIKRTPCFGKCPEYEAFIYTSGYCIYNGRTFAQRQGVHTGRLSSDYLRMMADSAIGIGYFEFRQKYDEKITDVPVCYTEVHLHGQVNKVMNRWGAPEALKRYERFIDHCLETVEWKKDKGNNY